MWMETRVLFVSLISHSSAVSALQRVEITIFIKLHHKTVNLLLPIEVTSH